MADCYRTRCSFTELILVVPYMSQAPNVLHVELWLNVHWNLVYNFHHNVVRMKGDHVTEGLMQHNSQRQRNGNSLAISRYTNN